MAEVADAPVPAAAAAPAVEFVTIVNTGRGPMQILPGKNGVILANSQNTLKIPKELADRLLKTYPLLKDAKSIFPDAANIDQLRKENADLKAQAAALQGLLNNADKSKGEANAELIAQVADLSAKLADFQAAKNKADLDAVKEKHADAAAAPAA
jgi:hypothetical protein